MDGYMGSLKVLLFFIKSSYHCHCMVLVLSIDVEYIYGFVRWGGLQTKSMTSQ